MSHVGGMVCFIKKDFVCRGTARRAQMVLFVGAGLAPARKVLQIAIG